MRCWLGFSLSFSLSIGLLVYVLRKICSLSLLKLFWQNFLKCSPLTGGFVLPKNESEHNVDRSAAMREIALKRKHLLKANLSLNFALKQCSHSLLNFTFSLFLSLLLSPKR